MSRTVLIVEDDRLLLDLMGEVLEDAGFLVLSANGPRAAIEIAENHIGRIDLLLSDIVMPGDGGLGLAKRLVPHHPEIRVLYMSGYTDQILADRGGLSAGDAFLRKPFGNGELVEKVREVLEFD